MAQAAIDNDGLFYLIADENIKETAYNTSQEKIDAQVANGTLYRADSLEELAEQIGVDPAVFVQTIKDYNSYVDRAMILNLKRELSTSRLKKHRFMPLLENQPCTILWVGLRLIRKYMLSINKDKLSKVSMQLEK